jgi:tRNA dimethylallyltransferase
MADRWHPNERRKIARSLEIYLRTGKPASQVYEEQALRKQAQLRPSSDSTSPPGDSPSSMRYSTLLFWIHASSEALNERLNARVDKMLAEGLLSEVSTLNALLAAERAANRPVDTTRGIWVSIGYKEFAFLRDKDNEDAVRLNGSTSSTINDDTNAAHTLDQDQGESQNNDKTTAVAAAATATTADLPTLHAAAIEKVKGATRQYAKRQVRWIRIKLANALLQAAQSPTSPSSPSPSPPQLFLLDGTDLSRWTASVEQPALDVTAQFLAGAALPDARGLSEAAAELLRPKGADLSRRRDLWVRRTCEVCGVVAVTGNEWEMHVKSRGHRRAMKGREKREMRRERGRKESVEEGEDGFEGPGDLFAGQESGEK